MKIIGIKIVNKSKHPLPGYETSGAAGMDLRANLSEEDNTFAIFAGETRLVPTGIFVQIPRGFELQVRPRSGLSVKTSLRVANAPGTIDSDYRGEIKVILHNTSTGNEHAFIRDGDRIAQIVPCEVPTIKWEVVSSLEETKRGTGGFGSTGK